MATQEEPMSPTRRYIKSNSADIAASEARGGMMTFGVIILCILAAAALLALALAVSSGEYYSGWQGLVVLALVPVCVLAGISFAGYVRSSNYRHHWRKHGKDS